MKLGSAGLLGDRGLDREKVYLGLGAAHIGNPRYLVLPLRELFKVHGFGVTYRAMREV